MLNHRRTILFFMLYIYISCRILDKLSKKSQTHVKSQFGNNTLLIIAHPDDESMFFGPTLLNLIDNGKYMTIYCLTTGDADGLGDVRRRELDDVTKALGPKITLVIDKSNRFIDSSSEIWNVTAVSDAVFDLLSDRYLEKFQTILTFDSYGVSGHINHGSIYNSLPFLKEKYGTSEIKFITLKSISILRKYLSFLEAIIRYAHEELIGGSVDDDHYYEKDHKKFTLSLNLPQYFRLKEILKIHTSQMVWFRLLYMNFSSYMFFNDLEIYT